MAYMYQSFLSEDYVRESISYQCLKKFHSATNCLCIHTSWWGFFESDFCMILDFEQESSSTALTIEEKLILPLMQIIIFLPLSTQTNLVPVSIESHGRSDKVLKYWHSLYLYTIKTRVTNQEIQHNLVVHWL
jgi:hypothetical protein